MNEIIEKEEVKIENMIYEVRGKEVMLDSDLARLYQCTNGTKDINKAVKRHINRFPERFMFKLTNEEYREILRFQTGTLELQQGKYSKYLPYVFTEQGVAMLATVLRTSVAEVVSIAIMDAFVMMRKYIGQTSYNQRISSLEMQSIEHSNDIKMIKESLNKLSTKEKNNHIFFEGQIYDAYSLMLDIFGTSEEDITIIDNYVDKKLLDILSKTDKNITIYSKNIDSELIKKYQSQYHNLIIKCNTTFHDRFIIIDKKVLYHCGASFKDLGKKCFGINKIEDKEILTNILNFIRRGSN